MERKAFRFGKVNGESRRNKREEKAEGEIQTRESSVHPDRLKSCKEIIVYYPLRKGKDREQILNHAKF